MNNGYNHKVHHHSNKQNKRKLNSFFYIIICLEAQKAVLAILANLAFKFGMVVFIGGWALARQVATGFGAIACGVLLGLFAL